MTNTPFAKPFLALAVFYCFCFALPALAQDKDWRPISPSDLSAASSTVEPNADAEAIFWEVRVDDSNSSEVSLNHYVRLKIFTEKGREDYSKHDILFLKGTKVKDVEAKVTKPDGSAIYLDKKDVMEREIIKANGFKVRAKSFALPGLEIGSIVEYKYREVIDDGSANMRLMFQRDIPIRTISYYVRPFNGNKSMLYTAYNMKDVTFVKDKNDYYRATMNNVPAFHEEPYSLPEDELKSWVYLYYSYGSAVSPMIYWGPISQSYYELSKKYFKPNKEIKSAVDELIAGASSDDEKLRRIYNFVKTNIRNISYSKNPSDEDRKRVGKNETAGDVLKLKMGTSGSIDQLFGAMAGSAGFDVRLALSGDRSEIFLNPNIANRWLMINSMLVAINVGGDWKFFHPGNYFSPYGSVSWTIENEQALITDPKDLLWKRVPLSPPETSLTKRSGTFKLLPDGTLEGDGTFEYSGHDAYYHKYRNLGETDADKEGFLKNLLIKNLSPSVELISFSIENGEDPEKPFIYKFKIRVPNYAVRTGKRIFFVPNVYEAVSKPVFTAAKRNSDVYVSYPWKETESIVIKLPEGFSLESGDSPSPLSDSSGILKYSPTIGISQDKKELHYSREFSFGNGGHIRFGPNFYPAIKQMFEIVNKGDLHQLTLRQDDKATATAQ
jgi:hypothetical protein